MVQLLSIALTPLQEINPKDYNRKALVDSQPSHHELLGPYHYDVIIDHHPRLPETKARLVDIRPEYGATSTIMTEYLREARIKPSLKLATALYYGIKTDTANFERPAIEADVRAFHYLFGFTRRPLVRRLEFAEFNIPMLGYFQQALNRFRIRHNRLYAFLGPVNTPDILVILADFFLRAGEVSWTIVGGIYQDRLVVIFRNDGLRKNAGRLALQGLRQAGLRRGPRRQRPGRSPPGPHRHESHRPVAGMAGLHRSTGWRTTAACVPQCERAGRAAAYCSQTRRALIQDVEAGFKHRSWAAC